MKIFTKNDKKDALDLEIKKVSDRLAELSADSEEYTKLLNVLDGLYKTKSGCEKPNRISPDTLAVVLGNLIGIVIILKHEEINVITSKALGFVLKGRV